jgi:hypothetical protein
MVELRMSAGSLLECVANLHSSKLPFKPVCCVCRAAGQQHGEQQHTCRAGTHQEPGAAAPAVAAASAQRGSGSHAPCNTGKPVADAAGCAFLV